MMRKILPALGLVCVGAAAQAQSYIENTTSPRTGYFNISGYGMAEHFRTSQNTTNGGNGHLLMMSAAGIQRWGVGMRLAETGSDLGSDYSIFAYQDNGNFLGEHMTIKRKTGFTGIGENTPGGKLHIGALAQVDAALVIGKGYDPGNTNVPMGAPAGGYNIDFRGYRDIHPEQVGARIRAERINNHAAGAALVQAMDIAFLTSTGMEPSSLSEKMRIRFDGNVGIGVADPKHKLTVEGTVAARKVKVTAQTTWADFVFNDDYRLPSLGELDAFIKQHRHLPEMPAEAEVLKEGIDIGDMNKKLLQKVEELTLYLIDEHKKNEQQQQQIKALEETVAKLQSANK